MRVARRTRRAISTSCRPEGWFQPPPRDRATSGRAQLAPRAGFGKFRVVVLTFEHVLVVGAGQMGGGIAQVVAASGRRVSLHDAAPGATERGLAAMRKSLTKLADNDGGEP